MAERTKSRNLLNQIKRLKVKQSPTFVPTYIEFTPQQTDEPQLYSETFDDRKHYFMISVSEMFLSYQRLWHQNFSPMVFSVCNFKYNGSTLEIPYVIGPSLLKKFEQRLPTLNCRHPL